LSKMDISHRPTHPDSASSSTSTGLSSERH
ncbi:uncharacterized protein METZ01_LOCUS508389, partial [marine metagenome]